VNNVDQHVESVQKIFAEDTAKVVIDGLGILDVKHEYLVVADRVGPSFEQVDLCEGGGCVKSDSRYHG